MFEDTANEYGWLEQLGDAKPSVYTQAYKDLFAGAGQSSSSLFRGMVTLWATEKCYLLAWTHAKAFLPSSNEQTTHKDAMQKIFIPNWSSDEFVGFVDVLEKLINEMASAASQEDMVEAEQQWLQVLWAEENFWPSKSRT